MSYRLRPGDVPPIGRHGVGWIWRDQSPVQIRVVTMGVVKPANDDAEFWRLKAERECLDEVGDPLRDPWTYFRRSTPRPA